MEEALLHGDVVNIEAKRIEFEEQKLSRSEIREQLTTQYRAFSKKKAFTCPCCDEPVNMNLTVDNGRPFYFKHMDGKKCIYSENSKTYETQASKHQDKKKKDIGLTVFKEILEGQLKPFRADIERGYFYKKKLSFIPDFIVRFPFSKEVWAIDYYTSISHGSYAHNLEKRMNTYKAEGFRTFAFIDDFWLAINVETDKGTLLIAEMMVADKGEEDQIWDQFLIKEIPNSALHFFKTEIADLLSPIDTRSIAYVNIENRSCKLVRFIVVAKNSRNLTFYKLSEPAIALERALTLNTKHDNLLLYHENEEELRQAFKQSLMEKIKQAELEVQAKIEALEKLQREEAAKRVAAKRLQSEAEERSSRLSHGKKGKADEVVDQEMLQRAKVANERPVSMSPEEWEWYKKTGRTFSKRSNWSTQTQLVSVHETAAEKATKEQRAKFKEKLLSQPIKGDNFIDGPPSNWHGFILKWIKAHQQGENLTVSMKKLLNDMKAFGLSFNQKDAIVQFPVKEFLNFYQTRLKKELKKKIDITIIE